VTQIVASAQEKAENTHAQVHRLLAYEYDITINVCTYEYLGN